VISLDKSTEIPGDFVIDYELMVEKLVINKLKRLFDVLGWRLQSLSGQSSLSSFLVKKGEGVSA
jgi:hypothetical protein